MGDARARAMHGLHKRIIGGEMPSNSLMAWWRSKHPNGKNNTTHRSGSNGIYEFKLWTMARVRREVFARFGLYERKVRLEGRSDNRPFVKRRSLADMMMGRP